MKHRRRHRHTSWSHRPFAPPGTRYPERHTHRHTLLTQLHLLRTSTLSSRPSPHTIPHAPNYTPPHTPPPPPPPSPTPHLRRTLACTIADTRVLLIPSLKGTVLAEEVQPRAVRPMAKVLDLVQIPAGGLAPRAQSRALGFYAWRHSGLHLSGTAATNLRKACSPWTLHDGTRAPAC